MLTQAELQALSRYDSWVPLPAESVALLLFLVNNAYYVFSDRNDTTDALIDATTAALMDNAMIGAILFYMTDVTPAGTLVCDGSTYPREDYPQLWDVLPASTKTETEFTVPDLIGTTIRGSNSPGNTGGSDSISLTTDQLPAHTHTTGNSLTAPMTPGAVPTLVPNPIPAQTGPTGSGQSINITNAYVGLLPVIVSG